MMVGRCISYWNSPFLGDIRSFSGVFSDDPIVYSLSTWNAKCIQVSYFFKGNFTPKTQQLLPQLQGTWLSR